MILRTDLHIILKFSKFDREISRIDIVRILRTEITDRRKIKNFREIDKSEIVQKKNADKLKTIDS